MAPEAWERVKRHFFEVVDLAAAERTRYVDDVRQWDPELARELEALLAADERATGPLDRAAVEVRDLQSPEGDPVHDWIGRSVGRWRITSFLARGGTSDVFRAEPPDGGPAVAVKVLHTGLASRELLRRFTREKETLAGLRHPGIVALLGAELLADGRPALVMEHVDGEPIDRHCHGMRDEDRTLALFVQVCDAVRHAHRNLVVHRDLKPQNILVQADGTPKVLDFGVVKILAPDRSDEATHPGRIAPLTLKYASPEQRRGETITTATDVYSLGVLLDEVLAAQGVRRSRDLQVLVETATREDPELRYPTVEAFAEDLRRYGEGEPLRARPATRLYRLSRLVARHRASFAVTGGLLVLLLVSLVFLHAQWRRAQHAERLGWQAHGQALRVASFFHELLDASDPETLRADPGLVEALERAAEDVGTRLADYPEAEGRLRYSIARIYVRLGQSDKARPHALVAQEIAAQDRGFDENDRRLIRALISEIEAQGPVESHTR